MKQSTIEKLQNLAVSMQLVTVEDMQKHSIPQLVTMIANKMNELIQEVYRFEGDVSDVVKTQNDNIQYLLGEGLHLEVATVFERWVEDGTFDTLINQTALKKVNDRIDETNAQLSENKKKLEKIFINVDDFGAKGDGQTDDTEAIQKAIDYAYDNNISNVKLSSKFYLVSGINVNNQDGKFQNDDRMYAGLKCKDGVNIIGEGVGLTKIKIIPNSHECYYAFNIYRNKNISISDLEIIGDLEEHLSEEGEWGHGIHCVMSQNIQIRNIKITNVWGDGIFLGMDYNMDTKAENVNKNISIQNVEIDCVNRNCLSLCCVDGLFINNLTCKDANKNFPKSGIDIEAEGQSLGFEPVLRNIRINNLYINDCLRGIDIFTKKNTINYEIEINNYTSVNCALGVFCEDSEPNKGYIKFNNCFFKDIRYNSIAILNKSTTYKLIIDGINILNNGTITALNNPKSIKNETAISICCNKDMDKDVGNIILNNIKVYNDNDIFCRYPIFISGMNDDGDFVNLNNYKFKDIKITNINEYTSFYDKSAGSFYVYHKNAELDNFEIDNKKFIYNGNYNLPKMSDVIGNISTLSDINAGNRIVFTMDNVSDIFNGTEMIFKKENISFTNMYINVSQVKILGLSNPNSYNYLYTDQNGSELKIKLIDGEWYVVGITGNWGFSGGIS